MTEEQMILLCDNMIRYIDEGKFGTFDKGLVLLQNFITLQKLKRSIKK